MKKIIYVLCILSITFVSCQKNEIEEFVNTNTIDDIVSLELFANSQHLFADGSSALSFLVKAYGEAEAVQSFLVDEVNGIYKDSTVVRTFEFKKGRIPENLIKIYMEDGTELTDDYFSTTSTADSLRLYAQAGDVRSPLFAVALEQDPKPSYSEIVIPVIFHLLPHADNEVAVNNISADFLKEKIDRLNQVFANTLQKNPHSVDLNVKFELATVDPDGNTLSESGMKRHTSVGSMDNEELYNHYPSTAWDPDKYLNIWISKVIYDYNGYYARGWGSWALYESWDGVYTEYPKYIVGDNSILPFHYKQTTLTETADFNVDFTYAADIGILFSPSGLYDDAEFKFEYSIGKFFGLVPTNYRSGYYTPVVDNDVDFCYDTYFYKQVFLVREKTTYSSYAHTPGIDFLSYNIMDPYSSATTITYEQAKRIRTVLENCPLRQMRK